MKTYIDAKSFSVTSKIVSVAISLLIIIYNFYAIIASSARHFGGGAGPYLFVGALFLMLFIMLGLQLIYFPIGVIIDDELKQLFVRYLFLKPKTILKADIKSYQEIYTKSRASTYYGIVVYLKDGKQVLCSEFNLENYIAVLNYLEEIKIKYMGQASFSFYSYYMNQ